MLTQDYYMVKAKLDLAFSLINELNPNSLLSSENVNKFNYLVDIFIKLNDIRFNNVDLEMKTNELSELTVAIIENINLNHLHRLEDDLIAFKHNYYDWCTQLNYLYCLHYLLNTYNVSVIKSREQLLLFEQRESNAITNQYFEEVADVLKEKYDYIAVNTLDYSLFQDVYRTLNFTRAPLLPNLYVQRELLKFHLSEFMELENKNVTIISDDCWGAYVYKRLGLPYNSPFIWLFVEGGNEQYFKILNDLQYYMKQELEFIKRDNVAYPVAHLGDVIIHFNHYSTIEQAHSKWNERKKRMNWDNIVAKATVLDQKFANEFENIPFSKKVCFTPEPFDTPSSVFMSGWADENIRNKYEGFWQYNHVKWANYFDHVKWLNN